MFLKVENLQKFYSKKLPLIEKLSFSVNKGEIIEIKEHRYFIATQGHPEFQSNPFKPEPLFIGLIKNSL